jgi:tetratricopeptide (TPR) repeat protein
MIFLTTGEKIRSLRKKLGMRQQEIEDKNITRAFISMIETGKRGLSRETAKIIAEKFNEKLKSFNLGITVDTDYLLRTPEEDAEIYCYEKLDNIPTNDEIDVIIDICRKYNLTKVEAKAYKILGDYCFDRGSFVEAFINYMVSLDLFKETEDKNLLPYLYNRLGCCKLNNLEYIETISFLNRARHYSHKLNNKEVEKSCIYNLAAAYKCLGKFNEAIYYIDKYIELSDKGCELNEIVSASILKAQCFNNMANSDKALSILQELMIDTEGKDLELAWHIYSEMAMVSLSEGKLEKSLDYLDKAEAAGKGRDSINLGSTYLSKAKIYIRKGIYDEALKFAVKSLKTSTEVNSLVIDAYHVLIDIYSHKKDFLNLKNTYTKLLDILRDKECYKEEVTKLYNKLALLYLEQNDIEMCKKYLHMVS